MVSDLRLAWLSEPDERTYDGMHALAAEVAALGGAVGWLQVPEREQVATWLDDVLRQGARFLTAHGPEGDLLGVAHWIRLTHPVMKQNAEIHKVMTLPRARGRGVARALVEALVEDADAAGIEVLALDCRGNNHAAIGLYTSLGFVVSGRRPDWIAVEDERFDQVIMHLDLRPRRPPDPALVRRGGLRVGTGST